MARKTMRMLSLVAVLGLFALVVLAGCGGEETTTPAAPETTAAPASNDTSPASGDTTPSADEDAAAAVAQAKKVLEEVSGPMGTFKSPPSSGPKATPGKRIYLISYGEAIPYFHEVTVKMQEATKKLGWELTVWDGKFEVNQWLAGVRQGITAKADGIVTMGPDAPLIKPALEEAAAKGIPVVNIEGFDNDLIEPGSKQLFAWTVTYVDGTLEAWDLAAGRYQAAWAVVHTQGRAKALVFEQTDAYTMVAYFRGFTEELAKYPTSEVVGTVEFLGTDFGPDLQQKAEQAFLKYPDVNIVHAGADSPLAAGIAPAMRAAPSKPVAIGLEGDPTTPPMFEEGIYGMALNVAPGWEGYAALDALVRIFAGEKPTTETGIGYRLIDKEHNFADFEPYKSPIDYQAAYEEVWGVR